jgi:hypothetical protein
MVFPDGHTNVPTPKTKTESKQTPLETVVDLAVGRFALNDGRIVFASQQHDLNIQGSNLLNTKTVLLQQIDDDGTLKDYSWFQNDRRIQLGVRVRL